jgi:hypothetical protein
VIVNTKKSKNFSNHFGTILAPRLEAESMHHILKNIFDETRVLPPPGRAAGLRAAIHSHLFVHSSLGLSDFISLARARKDHQKIPLDNSIRKCINHKLDTAIPYI